MVKLERKELSLYIENRVIETADYMIKTKKDIRTVAKKMGISRSTVHMDLRERLPLLNAEKAAEVDAILKDNKIIGNMLGGSIAGEKMKEKFKNYVKKEKKIK